MSVIWSKSSFLRNFTYSWSHNQRRLKTNIGNYEGGALVAIPEVKSFIERCMTAVGTNKRHAAALADNLVAADHRGHFSHGLNRIEIYVNDIRHELTVSNREPELVREMAAIALVDGKNLLGPVVGNYCMSIAMRKAREAGVGWVVAKDSNHYGIAGYYSMQASSAGLVGMSFTNTSPLVCPTRSREQVLGTNPIAVAAPGKNGDSFSLDMATSAVALGKIELAGVKGSQIPDGWGVDNTGKICNDPHAVVDHGGLMPLGGAEYTSGYKGYGLGVVVEVLTGLMADAMYGPKIRRWKNTDRIAHLGQCFIAVDPEAFAPGFADRMQDLMDLCRASATAEGESAVLVAGDPEKQHMEKCDQEGGIRYHVNQITKSAKLAKELGIESLKTLDG